MFSDIMTFFFYLSIYLSFFFEMIITLTFHFDYDDELIFPEENLALVHQQQQQQQQRKNYFWTIV